MPHSQNDLSLILEGIQARATDHDLSGDWPAHDLRELNQAGAARWAVPSQFGGQDLSALALHQRYEEVATASVSTALILTQRDSAIGLIADCERFAHRESLLRSLCAGEGFATLGISQLTTSRRYGEAALTADRDGDGWRLRGVIPWSTGAAKAQHIVAGAVLEDGQQLLFVLPTDLQGVEIDPPMPLVALRSSWTAQVTCNEVHLEQQWVLKGPAEKVLGSRSKSLPAGQAFIAIGLCRAGLNLIADHPSPRSREVHQRLGEQLGQLKNELLQLSDPAAALPDPGQAAAHLRGGVNELALRITHAAVALYKGSSLLMDHSAQRLAREALFLLVWSCPSPVVDCTVSMLVGGRGNGE